MEKIFIKKMVGFIHKILCTQLKNRKNYTAATKTRANVRGGGRKPWKQKGTGQARAGSSRSSIWVGGGVSFGPIPHIVNKKINKKERRLALALILAFKKNEIIIVSDNLLNLIKPKTKLLVEILKNLKIEISEKILIVTPIFFENIIRASNNLSNVTVTPATNLCFQRVLEANKIIFSSSAYNLIKDRYGKYYT